MLWGKMLKMIIISLSHKDYYKNQEEKQIPFSFSNLNMKTVVCMPRWSNDLIYFQVTDHVMAGVEIIVGQFFGDNYIRVSNLFLPK